MLEKHWNGNILDSIETTLKFAKTMICRGKNPAIDLVKKIYQTGKTVKKETMKIYEQMIECSKQIGKWLVPINPDKCKEALNMEIQIKYKWTCYLF